MKETRRVIYKGGYLQFENLTYQNDALAAYAGESIVLRYDPGDITTVLVYRRDVERKALEQEASEEQVQWIKETFLAPAYAQDLAHEQLSLEEAKANSRSIREEGKAVDNQSMLDEIHDRDAFLDQKKKTRRDRQKEEQRQKHEQATVLPSVEPTQPPESAATQPSPPSVEVVEIPQFEIWDFDED